jgi:hypothetical protein
MKKPQLRSCSLEPNPTVMRKRFTVREILEGKLLKPLPPRCLFI